MVNNLTLQYLLGLAANTSTSDNVRGQALLEIDKLKDWMTGHLATTNDIQKANLLFGLSQIDSFKGEPSKYERIPELTVPPGAPIGMPAMDFLGNNADCDYDER